MLLQQMDRTLKGFPEVERVFGKAGRAETSTDPAPFSMMEVVVQLKPKEQWRPGLTYEALVEEMDQALRLPGVTNAWTMPIKARIDMLTTGVRTPVGIKIFGPDLKQIEEIGKRIEMTAQDVPGTRSVYAERVSGGYFLDFDIKREEIARYGLTVMDIGQIIESAIGGESIATTIEGRERYPINVRYLRELRDDPDKLRRVLVATPTGTQVPLGQLTTLRLRSGPAMIRDEDGMLSGYVYVDMAGRDIGGYVEDLKQVVREKVELPPGYTIAWGGSFENMERAMAKLRLIVPITIGLIFLLLYSTFDSLRQAALIILNLPFALIGGVVALWLTGEYLSVPASIGFINLFGVAVLNGIVLVSCMNALREEGATLDEAVMSGALLRLRPVLMTALVALLGLVPLAFAHGIGSEVQRPLAIVVIGGLVSSTLLTLIVLPILYRWIEGRTQQDTPPTESHPVIESAHGGQ